MNYKIFPSPRNIKYSSASEVDVSTLTSSASRNLQEVDFKELPIHLAPRFDLDSDAYVLLIGNTADEAVDIGIQGYYLKIDEKGILVKATDLDGFRYGLDSLKQILDQSGSKLTSVEIADEPVLKHRGLMLDVSRGKVYTREYLLELVEVLSKLRMNVLQLYIEHTYAFAGHKEIHQGSSPITKEDVIALQDACIKKGIDFQPNLQSLGHMNRILTRKEYMHLAESDMFWSLDTSSERTYEFLESLYDEFLPLFSSAYFNVCSDEPYDIGTGKSKSLKKDPHILYYDHIVKLHALAQKHSKKMMIFGDVVKHLGEQAKKLPEDIVFIDWMYDPKKVYGTPKLFENAGRRFWVSPGTGNWNTLFPRLDGSITNIVNLTLEGMEHHAEGMLLTDWNDHGGYALPGPSYYSYAYAVLVAWTGRDPGHEGASAFIDSVLGLKGYSKVVLSIAEIYQIPPLWSKNRSQCVMALFDEPIFGNTIRGMSPPEDLEAYNLELPQGVDPVFDRHSQHPLRPHFSIPLSTITHMERIVEKSTAELEHLGPGKIKNQLCYILHAFTLLSEKVKLSHHIMEQMGSKSLRVEDLILLEDEIRGMISKFVDLQLEFIDVWREVARTSEIYYSMTYFSNIIARYDYLKEWISIQRENLSQGQEVDGLFETYHTGGYTTLPTY